MKRKAPKAAPAKRKPRQAEKKARPRKLRLPEPRGRRGHSAVDDQPGLREWLIENYCKATPRPTLDEVKEKLKATGFAIGRTAVWEFDIEFRLRQAEKDFLLDLAKQYNETAADGQVLDIETAIATFGSARIFAELLENAGEKLSERDLGLLDVFRKLQSSSSMRERTKFAVDRGLKAMAIRFRQEMQALLKKDPDTLRKVLRTIESTTEELRS